MNQEKQNLNNNKNANQQEENSNTDNTSFVSSNREANPLFSDSMEPVSNNRNDQSEEEKDQQIKSEPDTARLRSERQSVIDGENKSSE